jgi:hypothetical protein
MSLGRFMPARSDKERNFRMLALILTAVALPGYFLIHGPNRYVIFGCGVVVAVALFVLRMKFPLVYGIVEVAFALFVLWDATSKGRGGFNSDFSADFAMFQLAVVLAQTFGAIYVLIRGLANCLQELPEEKINRLKGRIQAWEL